MSTDKHRYTQIRKDFKNEFNPAYPVHPVLISLKICVHLCLSVDNFS